VARFPLFGKVVGEKSVKDLAAGRPTPGPEGPSVVTSPMGAVKPAAKISAAEPNPSSVEEPATVVAAEKPASVVSAASDDTGTATDDAAAVEKKAAGLVKVAKSYIGAGMKDKAAAKLKEVMEKYPKTNAAIEAQGLLVSIQ